MEKNQKRTIISSIILIVLSVIFYRAFAPDLGDILSSLTYFISVLAGGLTGGLAVGILSPLIAGLFDFLSPQLSEVLLYLVIGNVLLVVSFMLINQKLFNPDNLLGIIIGVFVGAVLRVIPVALAVNNMEEVTEEMRQVLGFPQFFAAFLAGLILFIGFGILRRTGLLPDYLVTTSEEE